MSSNMFVKVYSRKDRERVFNTVAEASLPVQIKTNDNQVLKSRVLIRNGMKLRITGPTEGYFTHQQDIIAAFAIDQECYFMKTHILKQADQHFLKLTPDLYKLQKRHSFRLNLPRAYGGSAVIQKIGNQNYRLDFDLINISGGGFAFEIPSDLAFSFSRGKEVSGLLKIGSQYRLDFKADVRHSRPQGSHGSGIYRVGVAFQQLQPEDQETLIQLIMSLHKDSLSKFKLSSK